MGKKKMYKLTKTRNKVELTYNISLSATYECIKGNITTTRRVLTEQVYKNTLEIEHLRIVK